MKISGKSYQFSPILTHITKICAMISVTSSCTTGHVYKKTMYVYVSLNFPIVIKMFHKKMLAHIHLHWANDGTLAMQITLNVERNGFCNSAFWGDHNMKWHVSVSVHLIFCQEEWDELSKSKNIQMRQNNDKRSRMTYPNSTCKSTRP